MIVKFNISKILKITLMTYVPQEMYVMIGSGYVSRVN